MSLTVECCECGNIISDGVSGNDEMNKELGIELEMNGSIFGLGIVSGYTGRICDTKFESKNPVWVCEDCVKEKFPKTLKFIKELK